MRRNTALAVDGEEAVERKSAACSSSSRSRPRPPLYLASLRRADGRVVTFDPAGRVTAIAYDRPNLGRTETAYGFNRLKGITDPVNTGNAVQGRTNVAGARRAGATNITYAYGLPGAPNNTAGRITRITSQMGVEERQYGRLGETIFEKKTVTTFTDPLHPSVFESRFFFDTFGRMLRITYPDGEVVTNVYDSGGNLQSSSGVKAQAASGANHRYTYLRSLFYDQFEQRALVEQGNGVKTAYTYDAQTRRLNNLTARKNTGDQFQNLLYSYDNVGNVTELANQVAVPPPNQFGGPTLQHFEYDDLYRLTSAFGTFQTSPQKTHRYDLAMQYDSIHNITQKTQTHVIQQPSGVPIPQKKTTYDFGYAYNASGLNSIRPHAPIHIGERAYTYDANGNQTGWTHDQNGTRRTIVWDEENRIQSLFDNGHEKTYKYDDQGNRLIKRGPQGETVYVNQFYTQRPGATGTKHVYAGTTRIASKLVRQDTPNSNPAGKTPFEKDLYFYHPDHLGTSNYITDLNAKLYEHLEYFPFGEAWVEENSNTQRTPYLFTAKELDEETGLYYFGARYYDPRTSVWQSADPILGKYLPTGDHEKDQHLSGMGGVFNTRNLGVYGYVGMNPLRFTDPDGNEITVTKTETKHNGNVSTHYNINFTAMLSNQSSTKLSSAQLKSIASRMESQIKTSFTGKDGSVSWSTKVDIKVGGGKPNDKRHAINIVDPSSLPSSSVLGMVNAIGGSKMDVNSGIINVKPGQQGNASLERTSAHEFGHLGGLTHPAKPQPNLMTQTWGSGSTSVDKQQIESMQKDYKAGNLNQGL
jgi:RHS repeat-associated protein